jgi:hypothetical protein
VDRKSGRRGKVNELNNVPSIELSASKVLIASSYNKTQKPVGEEVEEGR